MAASVGRAESAARKSATNRRLLAIYLVGYVAGLTGLWLLDGVTPWAQVAAFTFPVLLVLISTRFEHHEEKAPLDAGPTIGAPRHVRLGGGITQPAQGISMSIIFGAIVLRSVVLPETTDADAVLSAALLAWWLACAIAVAFVVPKLKNRSLTSH